MAAPATELTDELVEEALFRIPPDDPASLVRASIVCKQWRRLVSDPGFHRRLREFHSAPPMLGVLCNSNYVTYKSRFIPTSTFRSPHAITSHLHVADARHGRVLLHRIESGNSPFVIWDPVKDESWELPEIPFSVGYCKRGCAAVLCAAAATGGRCDHIHCQVGPFWVVFISISLDRGMLVYLYSSEDGVWRQHSSSQQFRDSIGYNNRLVTGELLGNAIHFMFQDDNRATRIVRYDLATRDTSVISKPRTSLAGVLMTTEEGELGFAGAEGFRVYLWSRQPAKTSKADDGWVPIRVIELATVLPANLVGFACGVRILFFRTTNGIYALDLKSNKTKTICKNNGFYRVFPYTSFYPF